MCRKIAHFFCMLAVLGCGPDDAHLFFSDIPYPSSASSTGPDLTLELVQEWGDGEEGLTFGSITDLAVSQEGRLAILDRDGCRIWLINTSDGTWDTAGGCGEGPGEFRFATAASFLGDTLVVFDRLKAALVALSPSGDEIARYDLPLSELGALGLSDFHLNHDGNILAGLLLEPAGGSSHHLQIASFSELGGAVLSSGLSAPPIARQTQSLIERPSILCVGPTPGPEDMVFVANAWGPQVALLKRWGLDPVLSLRVPAEWARSREGDESHNHWVPFYPWPQTACGGRYAVASFRDQVPVSRGVWKVLSSVFVVADLRERTVSVLRQEAPLDSGSVFFMTPGTAFEDRFFFFANGFFDYPVVREYRLVVGGE